MYFNQRADFWMKGHPENKCIKKRSKYALKK